MIKSIKKLCFWRKKKLPIEIVDTAIRDDLDLDAHNKIPLMDLIKKCGSLDENRNEDKHNDHR